MNGQQDIDRAMQELNRIICGRPLPRHLVVMRHCRAVAALALLVGVCFVLSWAICLN